MSTKTYVLVVNLHSRQSRTAIDEIKEAFKNKKSHLKIIKVTDPKNIKNAFKKAVHLNPSVIILGGGDGTLITGIEYLSTQNYKGGIGLLPLGTANYLARNLSIPLDIEGSVERIFTGAKRKVPIGVANDKFFALTFVLGLTQAAAEHVSDKQKRRFGQLAYIMELARQTKKHKVFKYEIESPQLNKTLKGTTHQILVYNSDLNQQVKLVPDHDITKQNLKVVVSSSGKSKVKLYLGFLIHILTFGHKRPYMHVFEAESLRITTTPALKADYDGEPGGMSPFDVSMYNKTVYIIC